MIYTFNHADIDDMKSPFESFVKQVTVKTGLPEDDINGNQNASR
jgi:hypothetical protein